MTKEWIKEKIEAAHENAKLKRFYDCPECGGGCIVSEDGDVCKNCCVDGNEPGIDPNKNIGELLMLIISELSEALEAHRCGMVRPNADMESLDISDWSPDYYSSWFEKHVKDYFEDEIADVFIRLFDLCGYLELNPERIACVFEMDTKDPYAVNRRYDNIGEWLFKITKQFCSTLYEIESCTYISHFSHIMVQMNNLCKDKNIPIEKHIEAKMFYNKTRPHKHGKEY